MSLQSSIAHTLGLRNSFHERYHSLLMFLSRLFSLWGSLHARALSQYSCTHAPSPWLRVPSVSVTLLVAMAKHLTRSNWREEELIWAYRSREDIVHHSRRMWQWVASAVRKQSETGSGAGLGKACLSWPTFSSRTLPPKGSTTFQNSTASWGPHVQIYEPPGDSSHEDTRPSIC